MATAARPLRQRIVVVGAGVIGVCCALALRREGHDVTIFDPAEPGSGASSGNAGGIVPSAVVPVATPGILKEVPSMLRDPLSPLAIRWSYLPQLAPWLIRFVRAAAPLQVEALSQALAALLAGVVESWVDLLQSAGCSDVLRRQGLLYVYESERSWESARWGFELRRRRGIVVEALDHVALRRMVPALSPAFCRAAFLPDCAHVTHPQRVVACLAGAFEREGGRLRRSRVAAVRTTGRGTPVEIVADGDTMVADGVVIAAGAFSKPLARALGAAVPLDTERGYHAMLPHPGVDVPLPIMSGEGRFAVTPMEHGLRLAGTVELGGLRAPPNYERARILIRQAQRMFPGLNVENAGLWMGHRPSLPDSLPVIGAVPGRPQALLAFGHGHLGLTLGAVTGRLVADLVAGREPHCDLTPFRPDRFHLSARS